MPIYDYRCRACGSVSEVLIRRSSDGVSCPQCGSQDVERLVSASYTIRMDAARPGSTCCGRPERCQAPPCSSGDGCQRH